MTRPTLLAVGGAHVDRRGRVAGDYVPAASNPGSMAEDVGGGVFNAARTAAQRGVAVTLLSLRGGDAAGDKVAAAIAAAGITDLSVCYLDRATPSYTALLDRNGDLIAALADMGLYEGFTKQLARRSFRDATAASDALIVDANLPVAAIERLGRTASGKPVFAIGVSPAKVGRLEPVLDQLACLFINRREAVALVGGNATDPITALRRKGLKRGVVTGGAAEVIAFDGEDRVSIAPPAPRTLVDVTGAGDALAGAAAAALLAGRGFGEAVREGVAAAGLAIESPAAAPVFDDALFAKALGRVPEPNANRGKVQ